MARLSQLAGAIAIAGAMTVTAWAELHELPPVLVDSAKAHAVLKGDWAYVPWGSEESPACEPDATTPAAPEFAGRGRNVVRFSVAEDGNGVVVTDQREDESGPEKPASAFGIPYRNVAVGEVAGHMTIALTGDSYQMISMLILVRSPNVLIVVGRGDPEQYGQSNELARCTD